jgi:GNAT superfamily N-acetyltransferase
MDTLEIRPIEPADFIGIAPLLTELGYPADTGEITERLAVIGHRPDFATFVASVAGRTVGFVGACIEPSYTHDRPNGRIIALVVSTDFRNRGIGRRLVAIAEDWLEAQGVESIIVNSGVHRTHAHAFYAEAGYEQTGVRLVKTPA